MVKQLHREFGDGEEENGIVYNFYSSHVNG